MNYCHDMQRQREEKKEEEKEEWRWERERQREKMCVVVCVHDRICGWVSVCVVYFDQLSGAARTQKLVELVFFSRYQPFLFF